MYDKVKLWVDRTIVGDNYPTIASYINSGIQRETELDTGELRTYIYGNLETMKVSMYENGILIVGSLPKYLYGSNVYPLNRHTTAQVFEKMEDSLHTRIGKAIIREMEFGANFLMSHPVSSYLNKLGNMPRLNRYHFEASTLYYKGLGKKQPKVFAFYDKIADAKAKGMDYPVEMQDKNILRYEMRLKGRLANQLGVPEVTASSLAERSFYASMIKRFQDSYFSISKQNQLKTDIMSEIKKVSDAYDVFVARLISQTGQGQIGLFLDELKEAGVFEDRKNYTRLKKKIQEVSTKARITISDELIRELDNEIANCGAYY